MGQTRRRRVATVAGWAAFGASLATITGSTPIGVALVATLGAAVAWSAGTARRDRAGRALR